MIEQDKLPQSIIAAHLERGSHPSKERNLASAKTKTIFEVSCKDKSAGWLYTQRHII
jgi:hypothetical protein